MSKFEFHQDIKVEMWQRQRFMIEASTEEEAISKVEAFKTEDVSDFLEIEEYEDLAETECLLLPEGNGGQRTIELYLSRGDKYLGGNVKE